MSEFKRAVMNHSKSPSPSSNSSADTSVSASPEADQKQVDLPNLRTNPSADILLTNLALFAYPTDLRNFGENTNDGAIFYGVSGTELFRWLTSVVSSSLEWIESEDDKDEIWSQASMRMAERCGRTAAPSMTRRISIQDLREAVFRQRNIEPDQQPPISLAEPALTEDNLGLKTWGSSLILANRFARDANEILVNPVLELGSGTGLCGIVAGRLGFDVTLTDLPEIVDNLKANVEKNKLLDDKVSVDILDWRDPSTSGFDTHAQKFNSIIVSDPVYQSDQPGLVTDMIKMFLARNKDARLCLQLPLRAKFEDIRESLKTQLSDAGLEVFQSHEEEGVDDFGKQTYAWSLWKWNI